ncbi:MAG: hypothetical protein QG616_686 [Pseudomonadota bacterium]|nr:hypothetical protein [Pseudomonadota bacterium]
MNWLEQQIRQMLETAKEVVLQCNVENFPAAQARYLTLKEILDDYAAYKRNVATGDIPDDE